MKSLKSLIKPLIKPWLASALISLAGMSHGDQPETLEKQAKQLVREFVGELKPTLQNAMKAHGPIEAVKVCAEAAPRIAAGMSRDGWQVKRVSHKARNSNAKPDPWESEVLAALQQQAEENIAVAKLNESGMIDGQYRYMQGQVTEAVCLVCHGKVISPDVQTIIQQHYPNDSATGFSLGELRGAISLRKVVTPQPSS